MQTHTYTLAGTTVTIYFPETREDLRGFEEFLARGDKVIGFDTETSDLDIYKPGHVLRLAQFGSRDEAWVLDVARFADVVRDTLASERRFVAHNSTFDLLVVDHHLSVPVEGLGPRTFDTRIFAHLLDPRSEHEGGIGHGLKRLSEVYIDPSSPDTQKGLHEVFRKEYRAKIAEGWTVIDIDHPTYVTYAGLDAILVRRLFDELVPLVKGADLSQLSTFEHELNTALAIMQRRGMRVDVAYTERLKRDLADEAEEFRAVAARYGVENVNSTKQVAEALQAMGETLTEKTDAGGVKVDKGVLLPLADLDPFWHRLNVREPNPLADAVLRAKRAEKWATAYCDAFLDLRDVDDRIHPFIGGLQARTARMAVSRPPLQQLPSTDWRVRRALVADPGHLVVAADYDQIEMRVLAALADERQMIRAILDGADLHDFTATLVYGKDFEPWQRKLMKGVGFGKVYGGGAKTLSRQTGAPLAQVKAAIAAYDRTYPGIKRYSSRLQKHAEFGAREVVTPTGRHLPLDRDRLYSATNYMIQSTARDVLAEAILDLFDAGLGDYLIMPVHDEIIGQAPEDEAAEVARAIGETLSRDFYGVPLTSTGEVYGPSWGHGYGAEE